jgi:glycosyltransferase involved in cell wall biosynthesis
MPKFTIITINYNNFSGLNKTIQSVKEQNYLDFEFIVKDGFSTDGSIDLLKNENCISELLISNDGGIYDAFNVAIKYATGDFILFLNSGDVLLNNNSLFNLSKKVNANSEYDIYYWDGLINKKKFYYMRNFQIKSHIWFSFLGHSGMCLFRRDLFVSLGYYDVNFKFLGDREFFYRCILKNNAYSKKIQGFYSKYDNHGISNNSAYREIRNSERIKIDAIYNEYKPVKFNKINELFVRFRKSIGLLIIKCWYA